MIGERQFQCHSDGTIEAIHAFPELGDNDYTYDIMRALDTQIKGAVYREDWIAFIGLQELYKVASRETQV